MAMLKIQPSSVSFQGAGLRYADQLRHRQIEYAERVGLTNAEMDAQGRRGHHPPTKAGTSDRVIAIEDRKGTHMRPLHQAAMYFQQNGFLQCGSVA